MSSQVQNSHMKIYFYFEAKKDQPICGFIGKTNKTRHIWVSNNKAVIPHLDLGISSYSLI